jgi:sugar/nucleoside kinase (ribokinase family)
LVSAEAHELSPGFPVEAVDATGAGDSLDAAVLYGYLRGLSLPALGALGNATGAAKVQKLGTGHNLPTMNEVAAVLKRFGQQDLLSISS